MSGTAYHTRKALKLNAVNLSDELKTIKARINTMNNNSHFSFRPLPIALSTELNESDLHTMRPNINGVWR